MKIKIQVQISWVGQSTRYNDTMSISIHTMQYCFRAELRIWQGYNKLGTSSAVIKCCAGWSVRARVPVPPRQPAHIGGGAQGSHHLCHSYQQKLVIILITDLITNLAIILITNLIILIINFTIILIRRSWASGSATLWCRWLKRLERPPPRWLSRTPSRTSPGIYPGTF